MASAWLSACGLASAARSTASSATRTASSHAPCIHSVRAIKMRMDTVLGMWPMRTAGARVAQDG